MDLQGAYKVIDENTKLNDEQKERCKNKLNSFISFAIMGHTGKSEMNLNLVAVAEDYIRKESK